MTGPSFSRQPDVYRGRIYTPTLSRIANQDISCNAVHTGAGLETKKLACIPQVAHNFRERFDAATHGPIH